MIIIELKWIHGILLGRASEKRSRVKKNFYDNQVTKETWKSMKWMYEKPIWKRSISNCTCIYCTYKIFPANYFGMNASWENIIWSAKWSLLNQVVIHIVIDWVSKNIFDVPTDIKFTIYFSTQFSSQAYPINFCLKKSCVHLQSKSLKLKCQ